MKTLFIFAITLLLTATAISQNSKKTTLRFLVGPVYTTKTNLQHVNDLGNPWGVYSRDEKGTIGLSAQALASFYLAKKWRLNAGLGMDEKGFRAGGTAIAPADGSIPYNYKVTAYYLGVPISAERILWSNKKMQWSVDAGMLPQWRIFTSENGQYLLKKQFSFMGGAYGKFPFCKNSILFHPVFRYAVTQLQDPLIGTSKSTSVNAYSIGLEIGYQF